jgi:hypothetical protein
MLGLGLALIIPCLWWRCLWEVIMPDAMGDGAVSGFIFVPVAAPEDIGARIDPVFMFVPAVAPEFLELLIFAALSPAESAADLHAYLPCFVLP